MNKIVLIKFLISKYNNTITIIFLISIKSNGFLDFKTNF